MVTALNVHIDSVRVNQFACQAIGSLCEFQANKEILDRYNVCGAVTSALQRYVSSNSMLSAVFMKDTSNAAVAQWGCTAIYYIARGITGALNFSIPLKLSKLLNTRNALCLGSQSQEYQHKLVAAGACEAVTKALLKYSEYETISHACFRSLVVLLMNNGAYKSKLGALGVCGCVVESMHMFPYSAQVPLLIIYF